MTSSADQARDPVFDLGSLDVELDFARKLAANDKLQRDRAMRNLWRWLRSQSESGKKFGQKELKLLWKGLHYCMWMTDKAKVQEELADNIVTLITCFGSQKSSTLNFIDTFFQTMAREYYRIDRFRIDKFMMLTRRMFRGSVAWIQAQQWSEKSIANVFGRLRRHSLSGDNLICPEGLQNFMTEICLDEIEKLMDADQSSPPSLTSLYRIFCDVLLASNTPFLRTSVTKNLFDELRSRPEVRKLVDCEAVAAYALEKGKHPQCPVKNRRALYNVYNLCTDLQKKSSSALNSDGDNVVEDDNMDG